MGFFTKDAFMKKYTTGKKLGEGSFATVHLCVEKGGDKATYAVKIIEKAKCKTEDIDALAIEIEVMESIAHPHIVKLHESFHCAKKVYLVMEIMSGGELFDRIVEKEKYDEAMGRREVKAIASALAACHAQGIVHRDLKPENLLYSDGTDEALIKLADFGLAKVINQDQLLKTACGTPGYVAPEILEQEPYDEKVDVWSLGVIMYIILCGFPPFYDENNTKLFRQIKSGSFDFPAPYWDDVGDGPGSARELISQMLTVDPQKRLSIAQVLEHGWIVGDSNVSLPGVTGELQKFNARRKLKMGMNMVRLAGKMATLGK